MYRLTLIRHGKAGWDAASDFERPLTAAGEADVRALGKRLKNAGTTFDRIYASPSRRTTGTAAILCNELGVDLKTVLQPEQLYLASPKTLLNLLRPLEDDLHHVAIIGHNPGLSELAFILGLKFIDLATAEMVTLELDRAWKDIR